MRKTVEEQVAEGQAALKRLGIETWDSTNFMAKVQQEWYALPAEERAARTAADAELTRKALEQALRDEPPTRGESIKNDAAQKALAHLTDFADKLRS